MLTIGMLTAVLVDAALGAAAGDSSGDAASDTTWRWMVGLPAVPGAAMAAAIVLLPESPR